MRGGIAFAISALIILKFKVKVTLVLVESSPVFAAYLFGLIMTLAMIVFSYCIDKKEKIARFFSYWGKNSLFLMVTHEYLGIRGGIQLFLGHLIDSKLIVITLTFILVLLSIYLLDFVVGGLFRRLILVK